METKSVDVILSRPGIYIMVTAAAIAHARHQGGLFTGLLP